MTAPFDMSWFGHEGYEILHVRAGYRGVKRIVPPAGEDHAFDVKQWARRVEIAVSPTGRSVRVWVDGHEVPPNKRATLSTEPSPNAALAADRAEVPGG